MYRIAPRSCAAHDKLKGLRPTVLDAIACSSKGRCPECIINVTDQIKVAALAA